MNCKVANGPANLTPHVRLVFHLATLISATIAWCIEIALVPPFLRYDPNGQCLVSSLNMAAGTGSPLHCDHPNFPPQCLVAALLKADMALLKKTTPACYREHVFANFDRYMILTDLASLFYLLAANAAFCEFGLRYYGAIPFLVIILLVRLPFSGEVAFHADPLSYSIVTVHPDKVSLALLLLGNMLAADGICNRNSKTFYAGCCALAITGALKAPFILSLIPVFALLLIRTEPSFKYSVLTSALFRIIIVLAVCLLPLFVHPLECASRFILHKKYTYSLPENWVEYAVLNLRIICSALLVPGLGTAALIWKWQDDKVKLIGLNALIQLLLVICSRLADLHYYEIPVALCAHVFFLAIVPEVPRIAEYLKKYLTAAKTDRSSSTLKTTPWLLLSIVCLLRISDAYHGCRFAKASAEDMIAVEAEVFRLSPPESGPWVAWFMDEFPPSIIWDYYLKRRFPHIVPEKIHKLVWIDPTEEKTLASLRDGKTLLLIDQCKLDRLAFLAPDVRKELVNILMRWRIIRQFNLRSGNRAWFMAGPNNFLYAVTIPGPAECNMDDALTRQRMIRSENNNSNN